MKKKRLSTCFFFNENNVALNDETNKRLMNQQKRLEARPNQVICDTERPINNYFYYCYYDYC